MLQSIFSHPTAWAWGTGLAGTSVPNCATDVERWRLHKTDRGRKCFHVWESGLALFSGINACFASETSEICVRRHSLFNFSWIWMTRHDHVTTDKVHGLSTECSYHWYFHSTRTSLAFWSPQDWKFQGLFRKAPPSFCERHESGGGFALCFRGGHCLWYPICPGLLAENCSRKKCATTDCRHAR